MKARFFLLLFAPVLFSLKPASAEAQWKLLQEDEFGQSFVDVGSIKVSGDRVTAKSKLVVGQPFGDEPPTLVELVESDCVAGQTRTLQAEGYGMDGVLIFATEIPNPEWEKVEPEVALEYFFKEVCGRSRRAKAAVASAEGGEAALEGEEGLEEVPLAGIPFPLAARVPKKESVEIQAYTSAADVGEHTVIGLVYPRPGYIPSADENLLRRAKQEAEKAGANAIIVEKDAAGRLLITAVLKH